MPGVELLNRLQCWKGDPFLVSAYSLDLGVAFLYWYIAYYFIQLARRAPKIEQAGLYVPFSKISISLVFAVCGLDRLLSFVSIYWAGVLYAQAGCKLALVLVTVAGARALVADVQTRIVIAERFDPERKKLLDDFRQISGL